MPEKRWGPFTGAQLSAMFIAVVFALAVPGALFAAIGQFVAIQDPRSGRNAEVVRGNALKVSAQAAVQEQSFFTSVQIPNFYNNGFQLTRILQTTAVLALNRIHISHESPVSNLWSGAVWAEIPCGSPNRVAVFALNTGQMNTDEFSTPILLRPLQGQSMCISASFGPIDASTSDPGTMYTDVSGFVVSGTFTPTAAAPQSSKRQSPTG
jgi:hypothetical protein